MTKHTNTAPDSMQVRTRQGFKDSLNKYVQIYRECQKADGAG
ncbi:hypothetical protein L21SP3_01642 [Sedimentisphaera cyanobacteriorum]|uniref:Uncharacterized protein n=1 Tax=Sedimentisphaera cyanobacteriorum TaxID=1940790 RepID=A0A1Q2HRH1_9BACT|nr:hypothetical protein [Sedimentisphaera cyanobacteriorum]AQQ09823.1 hypothetical protein L21SP3_01642 [Sedimentisphaera cyanobacteriorum]